MPTVQHVSGNAGVALRATEETDKMFRHTGMSALQNKLPCCPSLLGWCYRGEIHFLSCSRNASEIMHGSDAMHRHRHVTS